MLFHSVRSLERFWKTKETNVVLPSTYVTQILKTKSPLASLFVYLVLKSYFSLTSPDRNTKSHYEHNWPTRPESNPVSLAETTGSIASTPPGWGDIPSYSYSQQYVEFTNL